MSSPGALFCEMVLRAHLYEADAEMLHDFPDHVPMWPQTEGRWKSWGPGYEAQVIQSCLAQSFPCCFSSPEFGALLAKFTLCHAFARAFPIDLIIPAATI